MTLIINFNEDERKMTQGLNFLEGCALQLPNNFLQLKNAILIEIMQQLNQLGMSILFLIQNHQLVLSKSSQTWFW